METNAADQAGAMSRVAEHPRHVMTADHSARATSERKAMNAKQLIEAATYFNDRPSCECDPESGVTNCMGCDIGMMATHILATIRPDDDEPVTRERLEADGWFRRSRRSIRHRHWQSQISVIEQHPEFIAEFETDQALCRLKSMGHLRRLVAALGE